MLNKLFRCKQNPHPYISSRRMAPWKDFDGKDIFEGSKILDPSGGQGIVKYIWIPGEKESDRWLVDYHGKGCSRLCLQIGDKGQGVVV